MDACGRDARGVEVLFFFLGPDAIWGGARRIGSAREGSSRRVGLERFCFLDRENVV